MKAGEILNFETIGTKASGLEERSIDDCLNCQKKKCDGCIKDRSEKEHEYYIRRKERGEKNEDHFLGMRADGLIPRTVKYCLNCKRPKCDGCPTRAEKARIKKEECNGFD